MGEGKTEGRGGGSGIAPTAVNGELGGGAGGLSGSQGLPGSGFLGPGLDGAVAGVDLGSGGIAGGEAAPELAGAHPAPPGSESKAGSKIVAIGAACGATGKGGKENADIP